MSHIFVKVVYSKLHFSTDAKRMEFLFELYEKNTGGLFAEEKEGEIKEKIVKHERY